MAQRRKITFLKQHVIFISHHTNTDAQISTTEGEIYRLIYELYKFNQRVFQRCYLTEVDIKRLRGYIRYLYSDASGRENKWFKYKPQIKAQRQMQPFVIKSHLLAANFLFVLDD